MRTVLFVDDEPLVCESLRRGLSQQRPPWQLVFVGTGAAALAELDRQAFDAIVADIDLPIMDGPQLLAEVRDRHPGVVRLCLCGSVDDGAMVRAIAVTHQFLSKPCSAEALCEVVDRACSLRAILQHEPVRALIGRLGTLPATAQTFQALSAAMSQPNAHTADITQIVSKDSSLCIRVLQLVNSAFFRRSAPITSIQAAVTYVGMEMIKSLALSARVFNALEDSPAAGKLLQDLQARSLRKACLARTLLRESRQADEAFTAALLLDIGEAVLALGSPSQFERMVALARSSQRPCHEVEAQLFGVAHPQVGAYLLGLWGLPLDLIEAVAYHHTPSHVQHGQTQVLAAVHVADAVIDATAEQPARLLDRLDAAFVARPEVVRCLRAWNIDTDADAQLAQRLAAE